MATAQELTARQAYNDRVRTLKTLQIANGLDKGYEKEVDGLVAEFGQWISPQEIGDTVYNTYAGYGGNLVPATKYPSRWCYSTNRPLRTHNHRWYGHHSPPNINR